MMDVLESLTEVQISDFLSGRSPLTISLGVGAHLMYLQLQLSTQNVAQLQQNPDSRPQRSSELQTGLPTATRMSHSDSARINTTGSSISPASQTSTPAPGSSSSPSLIQLSSQRPRTSFNSTGPASLSSTSTSAVNFHHPSSPHQCRPPHSAHTSSPRISLPSGCAHLSFPVQAATPVCSPAPTGVIPGPQSPVPASTVKENDVHASPATELCKQPGAVIESFVNHSPGVYSGTFSGTLAPCSHSGLSHPRDGINIILQILNDLLRAAYHHQGAPHALFHLHCPASNPSVGPLLTAEEQSKAKSKPLVSRRPEHLSKTPGEESRPHQSPTQENQALHSKLERLQFLMHQRRLRRQTRRTSHLWKMSHSYQHRHHHP
nr:midnolin-like isoform X2 [Scatophagus argus]XP_046264036.1 midnolin-like isoform X2 [Scatophagus argus]